VANAEILRIIDVGAEETEAVPPDPPQNDGGWRRNIRATAKLALWPSPDDNNAYDTSADTSAPVPLNRAIVTQGEPVPLIHVEQLPMPERVDPRVVLMCEPTSETARSYRLLRHRLYGMGDPRCIAVSSARAGEGKTTCAVNLALALSEDMMAQVLLLEANLRHPVIGSLFGFEPRDTLLGSIARAGGAAPPYPIVAIGGTRLHVAALASDAVPGARLDRSLFTAALADLREAYDYVVIDTGPVLESGDADIVGECTSGVVLTARTNRSRRQDLRRAIDQLRPTPVLGTVLL
jgi:Mrp family chromosome partitioning ATPase